MVERSDRGREAPLEFEPGPFIRSLETELGKSKAAESLREKTLEALKTLLPREELVLKIRFGLMDGSPHTLEEVGRSLNVTRARVRQIEYKALRKLRHPSRATTLEPLLPPLEEIVDTPLPTGTQGDDGSFLILPLITPELLHAINTHPELLRVVASRQFERILAELLERQGYTVELQRGTKDGGIDIFALMREGPLGPHRYLVQAKRWSNAVGVAPVRELIFLHSHHRVTKSCLVTTSRFTKGAWQLAADYRWQLELRDYDKLREWIARALDSQMKRPAQ